MPRRQHKYHYLYKTTNLINNKFYVGMHSTDNLNDGYLGSGKYIRNSINKYGIKNFKIEFLKFFDNRKDLIEGEKDYVNENFIKNLLCMNLTIGGGGAYPFHSCNLGSKRSEATKLKMGMWIRTDEYREKVSKSLIGKHRTAESRLNMSIAGKGRKHTAESRLNMSIAGKGKNRRKKTVEERLNMSKAHIGKKFTEDHKQKIRESHLLPDWKINIIKDNFGKMSYRKIAILASCSHPAVSRTVNRLKL